MAAAAVDVLIALLIFCGQRADKARAAAATAATGAFKRGIGGKSRRSVAVAAAANSNRTGDDTRNASSKNASAAAICEVVAEVRPLGYTLQANALTHVLTNTGACACACACA